MRWFVRARWVRPCSGIADTFTQWCFHLMKRHLYFRFTVVYCYVIFNVSHSLTIVIEFLVFISMTLGKSFRRSPHTFRPTPSSWFDMDSVRRKRYLYNWGGPFLVLCLFMIGCFQTYTFIQIRYGFCQTEEISLWLGRSVLGTMLIGICQTEEISL